MVDDDLNTLLKGDTCTCTVRVLDLGKDNQNLEALEAIEKVNFLLVLLGIVLERSSPP